MSHWKDPAAAAALKTFASPGTYDLIHFCDLVMWPYVAGLEGRYLRVMDRSRVDLLFQTEELANLELGTKEKCFGGRIYGNCAGTNGKLPGNSRRP